MIFYVEKPINYGIVRMIHVNSRTMMMIIFVDYFEIIIIVNIIITTAYFPITMISGELFNFKKYYINFPNSFLLTDYYRDY